MIYIYIHYIYIFHFWGSTTNDTAALQKLDTTLRITGVILHLERGALGSPVEVHPTETV